MRKFIYALVAAPMVAAPLIFAWSTTFALFNYDTALVVNRALALYIAMSLRISVIGVVAASLIWYGLLIGVLWFHPKLRHLRERRLLRLHRQINHVHVWLPVKVALILALLGLSIWQLPPRAAVTVGLIIVTSGILVRYKEPLTERADTKPYWAQTVVMLGLAWLPAGLFPCMLLIQRWKLRWGWQVFVNALIQTYPCVLLRLLAGHSVHTGGVFQEVMLDSCRVLALVIPVLLAARWLLAHYRRPRVAQAGA